MFMYIRKYLERARAAKEAGHTMFLGMIDAFFGSEERRVDFGKCGGHAAGLLFI